MGTRLKGWISIPHILCKIQLTLSDRLSILYVYSGPSLPPYDSFDGRHYLLSGDFRRHQHLQNLYSPPVRICKGESNPSIVLTTGIDQRTALLGCSESFETCFVLVAVCDNDLILNLQQFSDIRISWLKTSIEGFTSLRVWNVRLGHGGVTKSIGKTLAMVLEGLTGPLSNAELYHQHCPELRA